VNFQQGGTPLQYHTHAIAFLNEPLNGLWIVPVKSYYTHALNAELLPKLVCKIPQTIAHRWDDSNSKRNAVHLSTQFRYLQRKINLLSRSTTPTSAKGVVKYFLIWWSMWDMEVELHKFLTWELGAGEWSLSNSIGFTPAGIAIWKWLRREKFLPMQFVQLIAAKVTFGFVIFIAIFLRLSTSNKFPMVG